MLIDLYTSARPTIVVEETSYASWNCQSLITIANIDATHDRDFSTKVILDLALFERVWSFLLDQREQTLDTHDSDNVYRLHGDASIVDLEACSIVHAKRQLQLLFMKVTS